VNGSELREPLPTCREIVALITDYLEDRMSAEDRERFERHLAICSGCVTYLDQVRLAIAASRSVAADEVIPAARREDLVQAFRDLLR
jgi:anti-sigma factor RsiW